jgi:hypothetical protein
MILQKKPLWHFHATWSGRMPKVAPVKVLEVGVSGFGGGGGGGTFGDGVSGFIGCDMMGGDDGLDLVCLLRVLMMMVMVQLMNKMMMTKKRVAEFMD